MTENIQNVLGPVLAYLKPLDHFQILQNMYSILLFYQYLEHSFLYLY